LTTPDDLYKILKNPDKEHLRIELKERAALITKPEELGYGLIALANRYGGKLIIGVTNDGKFEGKGIFNVDEDKGRIDNICNNNCSPKIEYQTEFIQCPDGDVLIINVNKRRDIPHAYIHKTQDEIKERIYYVRTGHGKRRVTDLQLEWMFRNSEDPSFQKSYSIQIPYYRKDLKIPLFRNVPSGNLVFNRLLIRFFNQLTDEDKKYLFSDEVNRLSELFLELIPFIVLFELKTYFHSHWSVNIEKRAGSTSISPRKPELRKQVIDFSSVYKQANRVLSNLSVDLRKIARECFFELAMPEGVTLTITPNIDPNLGVTSMKLIFICDNLYEVSVEFRRSAWSVNLPSHHPILSMLKDEEYIEYENQFATVTLDCTFVASFNFFDADIPDFFEIMRWVKDMENLLEEKLSWERFVMGLPDGILYRIDRNIQDLLGKLKNIDLKS